MHLRPKTSFFFLSKYGRGAFLSLRLLGRYVGRIEVLFQLTSRRIFFSMWLTTVTLLSPSSQDCAQRADLHPLPASFSAFPFVEFFYKDNLFIALLLALMGCFALARFLFLMLIAKRGFLSFFSPVLQFKSPPPCPTP